MAPFDPASAIVELLPFKTDGALPAGAGLLVSRRHVIVSRLALLRSGDPPSESLVSMRLAARPDLGVFEGRLVPDSDPSMAILEIPEEAELPRSVKSPPLALVSVDNPAAWGVRAYGFRDGGVHTVEGALMREGDGAVFRASNGDCVSGGVIWDAREDAVVGIVEEKLDDGVFAVMPFGACRAFFDRFNLNWRPACPYPGLAPYSKASSSAFQGRKKDLRKLLALVQTAPLTAVVGPTGIGKSSLVLAGLLPNLASWRHVCMEPGGTPFPALARAIWPVVYPESSANMAELAELARHLYLEETALCSFLQPVLADNRILLFVDAFESLFWHVMDIEVRRRFIASLLAARQENAVRVLMGIRAEWMGEVLSWRALADALDGCDLKLGPLTPGEIAFAIEKPVRGTDVALEAGLTDRILTELQQAPESTPCLSFLMSRLWKRQKLRKLTHADLEMAGGVKNALNVWADAAFERIPSDLQRSARTLLIRLAGPSSLPPVANAVRIADAPPKPTEALLNAGLIRRSEDGERLMLTHDLIVRHWHRLGEWRSGRNVWKRNYHRVDQQRRATLSRLLAVHAQTQMDSRLDRAFLLSAEACRAFDSVEARGSLMAALLRNPRIRAFLHCYSEGVFNIKFSPDGRYLASSGWEDKVILWDAHNRCPVGQTMAGICLAFSPNGALLATGSDDCGVRLWDARTGAPMGAPMMGHAGTVCSLAFSPDSALLASGSADTKIVIWDIAARAPIAPPLEAHSDSVYTLAFSPDGSILASGSWDATAILWDVETLRPVGQPLTSHSDFIFSLAFSPDGTLLATASGDYTVILWDVVLMKPVGSSLVDHDAPVLNVAFSPDGKTLATAGADRHIFLWDIEKQVVRESLPPGHRDSVLCLDFSPDGDTLASSGEDGACILWRLDDIHPLRKDLPGFSVAYSPEGKTLAMVCEDQTIRLLDAETLDPKGDTLPGHHYFVFVLAFSPDGRYLASASGDHTIIIWDTVSGEPLVAPLTAHTESVFSVCFSPDGTILASAGGDNVIILWETATGRVLGAPLAEHRDSVHSVTFSPDGDILASAGGDGNIIFWDIDRPSSPRFKHFKGHSGPVYCVRFSPDGKHLASCGGDKSVRFWDTRTRLPLGEPLKAHRDAVSCLCFSPDGRMLATSGADHSIILWDVPEKIPIGIPLTGHTDTVHSLTFSPDGKRLASGSRDRQIFVWDLNLESWKRQARKIANRALTPEEWLRFAGHPLAEQG